jgi:hypothetical protein
MATVPDVVVEVVETERDEDAVRAVGDAGSVMAGGDAGAEPVFAPGATPGAAATKKGTSWSPDEQNTVMEAYTLVSGDPTPGASQRAAEFTDAVPSKPAAPDES